MPRLFTSAGDFLVDDDGTGYADIGEEEDWGRADEKSPKEADGHATSKKRKDGSTAGIHGAWGIRVEHGILRHCSLSATNMAVSSDIHAVHCTDQRGSKRKSAEPDPKARQRMQGMFKRAPVRTVQRSTATDQSSEDLLSDILGSIGGDTG